MSSATACKFLGLDLPHPLVPSSSPLSRTLDNAKRLEDAGAAALVLYSLFEEEIHEADPRYNRTEQGHQEAQTYLLDYAGNPSQAEHYVEHLQRVKAALEIPVVASLNGISLDGWINYSRILEQAGADAIELNLYYVAADFGRDGSGVEQQYLELVRSLRGSIKLPISVKLSPSYTSLGHFVTRLQGEGADGVALFNRFYQPDIDIDSLRVANTIHLSNSNDALLAMHWISMLRHSLNLTLAATGGVHKAEDAVKMILAGADVVYLCSSLLLHGPKHIQTLLRGIEDWLEESPYDSLEQARGALAGLGAGGVAQERKDYMGLLSSYKL